MPKIGVKCCYKGCRKRHNLQDGDWARIKADCALESSRAGLICPDHFLDAVTDENAYSMGLLTTGELLAEMVNNSRRWRVVYLPPLESDKFG